MKRVTHARQLLAALALLIALPAGARSTDHALAGARQVTRCAEQVAVGNNPRDPVEIKAIFRMLHTLLTERATELGATQDMQQAWREEYRREIQPNPEAPDAHFELRWAELERCKPFIAAAGERIPDEVKNAAAGRVPAL